MSTKTVFFSFLFLATFSTFFKLQCVTAACNKTFNCPDRPGNFADPCSCRRYFTCTNTAHYHSFCPTNLYWDDTKKICTYKEEAICGPVSSSITNEPEIPTVPVCDPLNCELPFCFCTEKGSRGPQPEGTPIEDTPQMILIMIDGSVNQNNYHYFRQIFKSKSNVTKHQACQKNHRHLRGTFFLRHEYTNYHMVEKLFSAGHELAVLSVTSTENLQNANRSEWAAEINGMRSLLKQYANIPEDEILGIRAPNIHPGKDKQFEALIDEEFIWDSSISTLPLDEPVWPYTLDYAVPHKCKIDSCPTRAFPGVWEIPLNSHFVDELGGGQCSYLDQCVFTHQESSDVLEWLKTDFLRHYKGNRAPYLVPLHTNWFIYPHQVRALQDFISWSQDLDNIYYVTATELLLWMTQPSEDTLEALRCRPLSSLELSTNRVSCKSPRTCELSHTDSKTGQSTMRYMTTCSSCPAVYPWL